MATMSDICEWYFCDKYTGVLRNLMVGRHWVAGAVKFANLDPQKCGEGPTAVNEGAPSGAQRRGQLPRILDFGPHKKRKTNDI